MKKNALATGVSGGGQCRLTPKTNIHKVKTPKKKAVRMGFDLFAKDAVIQYGKSDFIFIDFLKKTSEAFGLMKKPTVNPTVCWEVLALIRTIPSAYFNHDDDEYKQKVIDELDEDYDEYELHYVHRNPCGRQELIQVVSSVISQFVDPKTHLLLMQAKLIPRNHSDHLKNHGPFKEPIRPGDDIEICYHFDSNDIKNSDFFERPLTSSTVPLFIPKEI